MKQLEKVRKTTVFTTHTPVAAGQHIFPYQLMDRYSQNFWEPLEIDREMLLETWRLPRVRSRKI